MVLKGVQIITYANSLGKNLKELNFVLEKYLCGKISGIHILPFYPSSADRGFSPLTHLEVDPEFGTWDDIKKISEKYELVADVVFNHISNESVYFQDYLKFNEFSRYKNLFLNIEDIFGKKQHSKYFEKIYRPRPTSIINEIIFHDSTKKRLWSTFTKDQIDVNWKSQITKDIYKEYLENLCKNGVKLIRADAVAYIGKKKNTTCFFIKDTFEILDWVEKIIRNYDTKILLEVHNESKLQLKLAKKTDYIYDFQIPIIALYSLYFGNNKYLLNWIKKRPQNIITVLDTHDGLGIVDVSDLMQSEDIDKTVKKIYDFGGNLSMKASGENSSNVDIYQINCTYYSATGENDDMYLCSRLIQLFLPGTPQIYYVGLLAGTNDEKSLEKENNGRDIMRHNYTLDEIENEMKTPVVKQLLKFIELRNNHKAFEGKFFLLKSKENELKLNWKNNSHQVTLEIDLLTYQYKVEHTSENSIQIIKNELIQTNKQ